MKLTDKDEKNLLSLIEKGKTLEAVRFVKEKTGMTLLEAKRYVNIKTNAEDENCSIKNNIISESEERHISALIKENKRLQAIAFLHKEKGMSLKEAKKCIDNKILTEGISYRRGFVFNEKLNAHVPDLTGQKKAVKIVGYILLILIMACLIQFYFSDRASLIKMGILVFSIVLIPILLIIYFVFALNIRFVEKRMKEIEEIELSSEFEVKSLRKNMSILFNIVMLAMLAYVLFIHIILLLREWTFKYIIFIIFMIVLLIFNCYEFLKMLKSRKYSLSVNSKTLNILYNNIEVNSLKIDDIGSVKFYAVRTEKRVKESNPTMQIFDKAEKKLLEISISIKDYYLLKIYFTKNDVVIYDSFNIF